MTAFSDSQGEVVLRGDARLERRPRRLHALWETALHQPLGTVSALVIAVLIAMAIFAPLIARYDPTEIHPRDALKSPRAAYIMGTDAVGRDVFSRIVWGARVSLKVGVVAVAVGTAIGALVGLVSGYMGGMTDTLLQRLMDSVMALPPLILALAVMTVLGRSSTNAVVAVSVIIMPLAARIVRGSVLSVKENAYVEAARAIGCSDVRILLRHIFPNVVAPIIVIASVTLGAAILIEAALSFLGLGTPPPAPSWGGMLSAEGRAYMERAPWLALFPGVAISLAVLAFNLLGDSIRDILDPRLRGTQ